MKTFVLEQPGRFAGTDTAPPGSPGPGDVLVQVLMVGVCGTDLHAFEGTQPFFTYPRILGHELAVEVIQAGEGVAGLKPGDRCAVDPYMACGECVACKLGRTNCCARLAVIGVHSDGGMRDRILLPATHLHKCYRLPPAQIPLVETLAVGFHAVGRASVQPGDRALVAGAGPIGLSVIEFLKLAGADIGVIEKRPERLEFARTNYGLNRCYPSHEEARQEEPSWLVFDCTASTPSATNSTRYPRQFP